MSLTPEEVEVGRRLDLYNGRAYHPVNDPYAFDRGGNQAGVFVAMLRDVAAWGRGVLRVSTQLLAASRDAARLADEDAGNTKLDRLATAADVLTSAGHKRDAAASAAAAARDAGSVNGPAIAARFDAVEGRVTVMEPMSYVRRRAYALNLHLGA